jgi:hypothetical protein
MDKLCAATVFEIIVADNNSRCGIDAVRQAVPTAKVVQVKEQGAGPARNAGVAGIQAYDLIGGRVIVTSEDPRKPNPVEAFETVFAFDFERYYQRGGVYRHGQHVRLAQRIRCRRPVWEWFGRGHGLVISRPCEILPAWLCR